MARDRAANRHSTDRREGDGSVEDMLRQIGADILDEPVPERLRRLLRPKGGRDGSPDPDDPSRTPHENGRPHG